MVFFIHPKSEEISNESLETFCAIALFLMLVTGGVVPAPRLSVTVSAGLPPSATGYNPSEASGTAPATRPGDQILFDDFSYAGQRNLKKNGWIIRTEAGWPGVPGAT